MGWLPCSFRTFTLSKLSNHWGETEITLYSFVCLNWTWKSQKLSQTFKWPWSFQYIGFGWHHNLWKAIEEYWLVQLVHSRNRELGYKNIYLELGVFLLARGKINLLNIVLYSFFFFFFERERESFNLRSPLLIMLFIIRPRHQSVFSAGKNWTPDFLFNH